MPHLGDPAPPQSRAEVNFVCFPDELLVTVVVASSGDADAANSHFSGIFKVVILHLSPSPWSCRHQPGTALGKSLEKGLNQPLLSGKTSHKL